MRFLVDNQLPGALARFLVERGYQAQHVLDLDMGRAKDREVWEFATTCNAVIVTKDEDFAALRFRLDQGPPVVWGRLGNVRNGVLLQRFGIVLPVVIKALSDGETIVEIA